MYYTLYIYIYQCSGASPNRDERVGNLYKICEANPGADRKNIQKYTIYSTRKVNPPTDRANIHCTVSPALYRVMPGK